MLKGGAFRLNMHPRSYFDPNPFHSNKPLGSEKKTLPKLPITKPFKPSSPAKKVRVIFNFGQPDTYFIQLLKLKVLFLIAFYLLFLNSSCTTVLFNSA